MFNKTFKRLNWYYLISIAGIVFSLGLAVWPLTKGSIYFFTDIARDFLILEEMNTGKVPLIGPRVSAIPGVFHGPLWAYINFPIYKIVQHDPALLGCFWFLLAILFMFVNAWIIKKYIGKSSSLIFCVLFSLYISTEIKSLYNPHGALFLIPIFIILLTNYLHTKKAKTLFASMMILGCIIQFQMAVGWPFLALSLPPIIYRIIKDKKYTHFLILFSLLLPLSTFVLFDLRHNFIQTRSVLGFLTQTSPEVINSISTRANQRLSIASEAGLGVFRGDYQRLNILVFALISFLVGTVFASNKPEKWNKYLYTVLYFYIGYFLLSVAFGGILLNHHWLPIASLGIMFPTILVNSKYKLGIKILIVTAIVFGSISNFSSTTKFVADIGLVEDDWVFQKNIVETIYKDVPEEFGYFVFSPDIYAYEGKAAMVFGEKKYPQIRAQRQIKSKTTYIIIAPPPPNQPFYNEKFWLSDKVNIKRRPNEVVIFPADYRVEKYDLSEQEINNNSGENFDWMTFR